MNWKQQHRQNEFKGWLEYFPYKNQLTEEEFQTLWNLYDAYRCALEEEQATYDRAMHCSQVISYQTDINKVVGHRIKCKEGLSIYLKKLCMFYTSTQDSVEASKMM